MIESGVIGLKRVERKKILSLSVIETPCLRGYNIKRGLAAGE